MTYITEQPIIGAAILAVLGVVLLIGWVKSGVGKVALAGLVCFLLIPVVLAIGSAIETETEIIKRVLRETAEAIRSASAPDGDYTVAVSIIDDPQVRDAATRLLEQYRPGGASITGFRSVKISDGSPLTATVDLNAKGRVRLRGGGEATIPRRVILDMEKIGDDWKIIDFEHRGLVGGPDMYSNQKFGQDRRGGRRRGGPGRPPE